MSQFKKQYVVDQNMLRSDDLEKYLSEGNQIIITDHLMLEPFKAEPKNHSLMINRNLQILTAYPNQTIVISGGLGDLMRIEKSQGFPISIDQLVSEENTLIFNNWLENHNKLIYRGLNIAMERINEDQNYIKDTYKPLIQKLSSGIKGEERRRYKGDKSSRVADIKDTALELLKIEFNHDVNSFIEKKSIWLTFCIVHIWRILDWAIKNGADSSKSINGDQFDIKYVVLSCFFDGLLTKEKWMMECRKDTLTIFNDLQIQNLIPR